MPRAWHRTPKKCAPLRTPLKDAKSIMGREVHSLEDIQAAYNLNFEGEHERLMLVPFTTSELEWAAEYGIVLTLRIHSAHRMERLFPESIAIAREVREACRDEVQSVPRQINWHLVMRPLSEGEENRALKMRPQTLALPAEPAGLAVLLAMTYADLKINGGSLIPEMSARYTRAVIESKEGVRLRRVIVNGPGQMSGGPGIRVMTSYAHSAVRPALAWRPQIFGST